MLRARLAIVVLAGGLGLVSGCSTLCNLDLFHRRRAPCPEVIDLGVTSMGDGPCLDAGVPRMMPPNGTVSNSTLTPQATVPSLSSPPRLVPQPHSQPTPYSPNER